MNYAEDRLDRRTRLGSSSSYSALATDLDSAHCLLRENLSKGHDLAAKTLRDGGLCRQAVFHYAMAWKWDFSDGIAAGNYAQMTELAGFPEIGILSLFYYRLATNIPSFLREEEDGGNSIESSPGNIFRCNDNSIHETTNCGCGIKECGLYCCYIPFPIDDNDDCVMKALLSSFESFEAKCSASAISICPFAASISTICIKKQIDELNNLSRQLLDFPILRFWEGDDYENRLTETTQDIDDDLTTNKKSTQFRCLPFVLKLLLLKLLYSNPFGGAFLQLACIAVPHIFLSTQLTPELGKKMAKQYKSHWAYFIFVKELVLGNRMKLHRRKSHAVPYHVPVWDVVWRIDKRDIITDIQVLSKETNLQAQNYVDISSVLRVLLSQYQNISTHAQRHIEPIIPFSSSLHNKHMYILGDSHILSISWQTLCYHQEYYTIIPYAVTGLKAWHVISQSFFTFYNLCTALSRLPSTTKVILFSAGEIDIREGIGGKKLESYKESCLDLVQKTATDYIASLQHLSSRFDIGIWVLPVAPHAYRSAKNGKRHGREMRRVRTCVWNNTLRSACGNNDGRVRFLDYDRELRQNCSEEDIQQPVLKGEYNADFTHMNSAFLPVLEKALEGCSDEL